MQALLDSFIQEINKIDDAGELRRLLIALKKEQIELADRESERLRAQAETALLYQQLLDEAKGLRRENEEMKKKLEKLESRDKLDTNRLFGRKTEKMNDLLNTASENGGTADPLSEDAPEEQEEDDPVSTGKKHRNTPGKRSAGKRDEDLSKLPGKLSTISIRKIWTRCMGRGTGVSSAGMDPRKKR